jgi:hypothetical protein
MKIGSCRQEMDTVVEVGVGAIDRLLLLQLLGQPTSLSSLGAMVEGEDVQDRQAYPVVLLLGRGDKLGIIRKWVSFEFGLSLIG